MSKTLLKGWLEFNFMARALSGGLVIGGALAISNNSLVSLVAIIGEIYASSLKYM